MMERSLGYLFGIITLIVIMIGIHQHNQKVAEYFPDDDSCPDRTRDKHRMDLTIPFGQFYFLLFILVLFFIMTAFS